MDWLLTLYVLVTLAGQPAEYHLQQVRVRASTQQVCEQEGARRARELAAQMGRTVLHRCAIAPQQPEPAPSTPERTT